MCSAVVFDLTSINNSLFKELPNNLVGVTGKLRECNQLLSAEWNVGGDRRDKKCGYYHSLGIGLTEDEISIATQLFAVSDTLLKQVVYKMLRDRSSTFYALCSGCSACAASLFGKLAGKEDLQSMVSVVTAVVFIVLLVISNAAVWTFFVKALQSSDTSLLPTVASSATNYICSAMAGFWFFGEITSLIWWTGTFLVLVGLLLICHSDCNRNLQNKLK